MIFYYVRHGDPVYEPDSLTELGHKQASALSKRFSIYGLDEIYSSSSIRAQQTAEPTCNILKKEKVLLPWAHEGLIYRDLSIVNENGKRDWFYKNEKYIKLLNSKEVKDLGSSWYTHPTFSGMPFESCAQNVDNEVDKFFLSLGFKHDRENGCYNLVKKNEKRIALFAHEGFGRLFMSSVLDIPYPLIATKFEFGHSSVSVIYFDESNNNIYPKVLQWSNDSHLYKEELLTGFQNKFDI